MFPAARFDDLTPGRQWSFALHDQVDTIVAQDISDVVPAIERLQAAVAQGYWAAGYISYEASPAFDDSLSVRENEEPGLPLLWFGIFRRQEVCPQLEPRAGDSASYRAGPWRASVSRQQYEVALAKILDLIRAGDTYQVNYTFRLRAAISGVVNDFYRDLIHSQDGAYGAFLDLGRYRVMSASPELFFRWHGNRLETRPMKGTAPRGRWSAEDHAFAARLHSSEKDRAEHLMIVDLLRNDLGRIAESGTVSVEELLKLEQYATVWQLTSLIAADVPPATRLQDILSALFPGGSITGAPKRSTMKIIAELETQARGVYCGAIGFLSPPGFDGPKACFNIAIRSAVVDMQKGIAEYGVGGGITWDSNSAAEYEEALLKAEVLSARAASADLLETLRYEPGEGLFFIEEHLDRMQESADYFACCFDRNAVRDAIEIEVSKSLHALRVRVVVTPSGRITVNTRKITDAFTSFYDENQPAKTAALDHHPVNSADPALFHKTTRRETYEQASARHPDAHDVILINDQDEITESTVANVVVKIGNTWYTPPLNSGCLPGVYRQQLLAKGKIHERPITKSEFCDATAAALINSVRGWQRIGVRPQSTL
ncbi:MAG: aminodeoxychorismate synthase component I [Gammaproteobacteria bacterium]|nr:aminodeoxychorismate synthase component I [Gammaproteobacteria bacterium]